jgi:hypothetical protein
VKSCNTFDMVSGNLRASRDINRDHRDLGVFGSTANEYQLRGKQSLLNPVYPSMLNHDALPKFKSTMDNVMEPCKNGGITGP